MQVQVKIGDQIHFVRCEGNSLGQAVYNQISTMIQQNQDNFELLIQMQNSTIMLDKNKTLLQQNFGQYLNNLLIVNFQPQNQNNVISRKENQSEGNQIANFQIQHPQLNQLGQGQPQQNFYQEQALQFPNQNLGQTQPQGQYFFQQSQQGQAIFSADQQQQPPQAQNQINYFPSPSDQLDPSTYNQFERPSGQSQGLSGQFSGLPNQIQGPPGQFKDSSGQVQGPPIQIQGLSLYQGPPIQIQSPGQFQEPPGQIQGFFGQLQGLSGQIQGPSGQIQGLPNQIQGPSGQFKDSSGQTQGPPIQIQSPGQFQEPSGQNQGLLGQIQGPPGQIQGPPGQFKDSSGQVQGPPIQIQGLGLYQGPPIQIQSPGQFQEPPGQNQGLLGQIQGPPGQIQGPPGQFKDSSGQVQGPPIQIQGRGLFQGPPIQQQGSGQFQGPPLGQFQEPPGQNQGLLGQIQGPPGQIQGPPGQTQRTNGYLQASLPLQEPLGQFKPSAQIYPVFPNRPYGLLDQNQFPNTFQIDPTTNVYHKLENKENQLKRELEDIQDRLEKLQVESDEKDKKIRKLQFDNERNKQLHQDQLDQQQQYYEQQIKQIQNAQQFDIKIFKDQINNQKNEMEELKEQVQNLIDENVYIKRKTATNNLMISHQNRIIDEDQNQNQINQLKKKNQELSKQIKDKDAKILNMEQEIYNLNRQLEIRNQNENKIQSQQNQDSNKLILEQGQKLRLLESQINELSHQAFVEQKKREDRDQEIRKLKQQMEELQFSIDIKEIEIKNDKKIIQFLQEQSNKILSGNQKQSAYPQFNQEFQRLQENMQKEIAEKKLMEEKKKAEEQLKQREYNAQKNQIIKERDLENKLQKQKKVMKLREIIMNTQGILQVGLLVDVTGSMDKYKDATMNIIQRTMACIKNQTNRDCEWGSVCYQDFAELKQQGQYLQHQFTRDSNTIINYLKNIVCKGGDDGAEDLRNGIKQMINNLKWEKYFKIALLICDAPCHGSKWAGRVLDDHPNEDLEDALQLLINNNIVLIGIEFTQTTDVMFAQMKSFYAKQNKQQMLIVVDLKNKNPEQIQDQLINIISEASISITEVNQSGTKSKKQNIVRDGAFEALIKLLPDPTKFNLDPKISTIQNKFNVYRVEINQQAFENNITSIYKIKIPYDYSIIHESEWNCIRTLKPFAQGQLKEVYLMKKLDNFAQNEVYVIKMPIGGQTYKTMNEALLECRSHLISKRLMQKFIQELNDKGFNALPIKYSDFLILKEHETSFWIAERFFQGEFIKFNNNFGYINPKTDLIYILSQVFSYYTYHISDFSYMICDIQGVGYNFTDPAINTNEEHFDETDQGQDGIGQFIISFDKDKKKLYQKYIDILELKD